MPLRHDSLLMPLVTLRHDCHDATPFTLLIRRLMLLRQDSAMMIYVGVCRRLRFADIILRHAVSARSATRARAHEAHKRRVYAAFCAARWQECCAMIRYYIYFVLMPFHAVFMLRYAGATC